MTIFQLNDLPLLYAQLEEVKLQAILDATISPHRNWTGISVGYVIAIWLCYIISESDHRLCAVEEWVSANQLVLQQLTGLSDLSAKDFTDDRLALCLDYLGKQDNWDQFELSFEGASLGIYDVSQQDGTIRIDTAPFQGYHKIEEDGLFQKGYSKQHPNIGQFKIVLATLDNAVNSFSYPLVHQVVSGQQADDGLYIPLIKACQKLLGSLADTHSKLFVADSKMGNIQTRAYIAGNNHYYLMPLSKVMLNNYERKSMIDSISSNDYKKVYKENKKGESVLVATGFEQERTITYQEETSEQPLVWKERLLFVRSLKYAESQATKFDKKIANIQAQLAELSIRKQGKKRLESIEEVTQKVADILQNKQLEDCLEVKVIHKEKVIYKRKYRNQAAYTKQVFDFELSIEVNQTVIDQRKELMGWQVYACNAPVSILCFEQCVWKYRGQNKIENRFDSLRHKIAPILPIFLQKEQRVTALVNLLMIALKVTTLIEYKAAQQLEKNEDTLADIYHGNPKQATATPTAQKMLGAFKNIYLLVLPQHNGNQILIKGTPLNDTQKKILRIIGFQTTLYEHFINKIQFSFSKQKTSES